MQLLSLFYDQLLSIQYHMLLCQVFKRSRIFLAHVALSLKSFIKLELIYLSQI